MTNNWRQRLDQMVNIYKDNYKSNPISCSLLPFCASVYLADISTAENNLNSISDIHQIAYYRKIERSFVDDEVGTDEWDKLLSFK